MPAAEVLEWLSLRRSGDRVLVANGEEGQPGAGCRVTAAELERMETVRAMAEDLPRAVRYTISLSRPEIRDAFALWGLCYSGQTAAGFAAAADPGELARAVAACDFLGGVALPAAAMVCTRVLPGTEPAAAEEPREAFFAVMERTSYGPALWGTMPVEDVDRLSAGGDGQADERGQAVAGMARAELSRWLASLPNKELARLSGTGGGRAVAGIAQGLGVARGASLELARRIPGQPDKELAMLRAHAGAAVVKLARAELLRRHPQLTPMTTDSLRVAVQLFCEEDGGRWAPESANFRHSPNAAAQYGPIALWDVSGVRSMYSLFERCTNFTENLVRMFAGASSFNQPLGAWDIRRAPKIPVARTTGKFHGATAFGRAANAPKRT